MMKTRIQRTNILRNIISKKKKEPKTILQQKVLSGSESKKRFVMINVKMSWHKTTTAP